GSALRHRSARCGRQHHQGGDQGLRDRFGRTGGAGAVCGLHAQPEYAFRYHHHVRPVQPLRDHRPADRRPDSVPVRRDGDGSGRPRGGRRGRGSAAPVPRHPRHHGRHRQAAVRQGGGHADQVRDQGDDRALAAAGAGAGGGRVRLQVARRFVRGRCAGARRRADRHHRHRPVRGDLDDHRRWRVGQREEVHRGRSSRRQGLRGAQGRRHRRHRRRSVQGHCRPGGEPLDQDHQHCRVAADSVAVGHSFRNSESPAPAGFFVSRQRGSAHPDFSHRRPHDHAATLDQSRARPVASTAHEGHTMKSVWLMLALGVTLTGMSNANARNDKPTKAPTDAKVSDDPYLWLEDIHGERPMAWVKQENARTIKRFADNAGFDKTQDEILQVLDSDARIPYVSRMGGELYNFWRDKAHPRGVWRRTTLAEYRQPSPTWEVLLDIDALNKAEGKRWVFKGVECLKPKYERCLVSLSPDGGDAVAVREFSIPNKVFVKDGFDLPVAKSQVAWIDENTIYVGTDFGPGSMTESSYPRIAKEWKRGTPLSAATTVYEGKPDDLAVSAFHDRTPGYERDFVSVAKDFFHAQMFLRNGAKLTRVDVPTDASADAHREWLLVQTKSPWTTGGSTYASGSLLAIRFDDFMAGKRQFTVLFKPDEHTALSGYAWTRHHLIIDVLDDVKSRLEVLTPPQMTGPDNGWQPRTLPGAPALSTVSVVDTDPDHSDEY